MACMDAESPLKIVHIGHQGESQYVNFKINDHPEKYQGWFKGWASPPVFAGLYGPPLLHFMEKGLWKPANKKAAVIVEDTDFGRCKPFLKARKRIKRSNAARTQLQQDRR